MMSPNAIIHSILDTPRTPWRQKRVVFLIKSEAFERISRSRRQMTLPPAACRSRDAPRRSCDASAAAAGKPVNCSGATLWMLITYNIYIYISGDARPRKRSLLTTMQSWKRAAYARRKGSTSTPAGTFWKQSSSQRNTAAMCSSSWIP